MAVSARAGARIKECEASFELTNFLATCAITKTVSEGKADCREIVSGPILVAAQYEFGIAVVWSIKDDGVVDLEKNLGVHVKRLDDAPGACMISIEMGVLNQTAAFNKHLQESKYHAINTGKSRGWSRSFDLSAGKRHEGVQGLPLSAVFDKRQGWLHSDALRVTAKLSVAVGFDDSHCLPSSDLGGPSELGDAFEAFLNSRQLTDVTIRVGNEQIEAHTQILSARSPVFAGMFTCEMRERKERTVTLEDLEAPAVKALISFLYSCRVSPEVLEADESALALLQAAHRYQVPSLVQRCVQALTARFDVDTVAERLEVAELMGCSDFKRQCLEFMRTRLEEVQATEAYERLVERRPALLKDLIEILMPPSKRRRAAADSST